MNPRPKWIIEHTHRRIFDDVGLLFGAIFEPKNRSRFRKVSRALCAPPLLLLAKNRLFHITLFHDIYQLKQRNLLCVFDMEVGFLGTEIMRYEIHTKFGESGGELFCGCTKNGATIDFRRKNCTLLTYFFRSLRLSSRSECCCCCGVTMGAKTMMMRIENWWVSDPYCGKAEWHCTTAAPNKWPWWC